MRTDEHNQQGFSQGDDQEEVRGAANDEVSRARDAARISMLMGAGHNASSEATRASIPMPPLEGNPEEGWNAHESMTLEGYERLRKGYERGINPEALERMEEHQESVQQFPPPAPSYAESTAYDREHVAQSTAPPIRIEPETHWEPSEQRSSQKGRIGPIAVTVILLGSIIGGLLLYAGGAEYLSGLFRSGQTEPQENLTLVTERPQEEGEVESEVYSSEGLTPGEEMELSGHLESEEEVASEEILADSELNVESTTNAEDVQAAEEAQKRELLLLEEKRKAAEEAQKKKAADALAERQAKEEKKRLEAAAKPAVEESTPRVQAALAETTGSGNWTVQVVATPDKAEADRAARKLRAKGGKDVHVIVTDKADGTIYRVRFGSFDSQPEAKTKAGALGFSNVWIVKK